MKALRLYGQAAPLPASPMQTETTHRVYCGPVERVVEKLRLARGDLLDQALDVLALLLHVSSLAPTQPEAVQPLALVVVVVEWHQLPLLRALVGLIVVEAVEDAVLKFLALDHVGLTGAASRA